MPPRRHEDEAPRSMSEVEQAPSTIHSASVFLSKLEDGQVNTDLTNAIESMTAALENAYHSSGGKPKGVISVKFGFVLDGGTIDVFAKIDSTEPKPVRGRSTFWVTPGNRLSVRNPAQHDLPFREVASVSAPPKEI